VCPYHYAGSYLYPDPPRNIDQPSLVQSHSLASSGAKGQPYPSKVFDLKKIAPFGNDGLYTYHRVSTTIIYKKAIQAVAYKFNYLSYSGI